MGKDVRVATEARRTEGGTASKILDVAERLVQLRGFNGFSYADVAEELGISKASLHYHFAGKAELGEALIERYASRFTGSLDEIETRPIDARAKLEAYAKLYGDVLRRKRMCLCGMLAAEYQTLPKPMRSAVVSFFDDQEAWLVGVLEQGREEGTLRFSGSASEAAQMIVGGLEGAMLVTRPYGDPGSVPGRGGPSAGELRCRYSARLSHRRSGRAVKKESVMSNQTPARVLGPTDGEAGSLGSIGVRFMICGRGFERALLPGRASDACARARRADAPPQPRGRVQLRARGAGRRVAR